MLDAKVGDVVRVRGTDQIRGGHELIPGIPGGVKLDRAVGDFHSWNESELVHCPDLAGKE